MRADNLNSLFRAIVESHFRGLRPQQDETKQKGQVVDLAECRNKKGRPKAADVINPDPSIA